MNCVMLGVLALIGLSKARQVPLYRQAGAPIEDRISDLLTKMNLTEKIAQLEHPWKLGTNNSQEYIQ